MKKLLITTLMMLSFFIVKTQDLIELKSGEEIKAKIIEITETLIKYKEFEFQTGPIRNIEISKVFMIIYENGKREKFTIETPETPKETPKETTEEPKKEKDPETIPEKYSEFSISGGLGTSYGGIGLRLQQRWGYEKGVGLSGSFGLAGFDLGFKMFAFKNSYIGIEMGALSIDEYYNRIYGIAIIGGGEYKFGKKKNIGINFSAGIGFPEGYSIYFAWELGLGYYFHK